MIQPLATSFLGLTLLMALSSTAHAALSVGTKKSWLESLKSCTTQCRPLALDMLSRYQQATPEAMLHISKSASTTLLYFHSYSLNPRHKTDDISFLENELLAGDINIFAPVLTAHEERSTKEAFLKVTPKNWILDAELALHLASALGQRVVIKGMSLGGLLTTHLARKYPEKISKIIFVSPAFMITNRLNQSTCFGQTALVHSLAKSFASNLDHEYLDKYLNGACALAKTMQLVLNEVPLKLPTSYGEPTDSDHYMARLDQVKALARSVEIPSMIFYSASDEALDTRSLDIFAKNLPRTHGSIRYTRVNHMDTLKNFDMPSENSSAHGIMHDYIRN
ncbi:Alpha/beta hydrolase family protein [compost metagenome]